MGQFFTKCKECLFTIRSKPSASVSSHQFVNLSINPVEESQGKIQAQSISIVQNHSHKNDQSFCLVDKNHEKNVNDLTLEIISNKQLSPQINQTVQQKEKEQFIEQQQVRQFQDIKKQQQQQQYMSIENGMIAFINLESIRVDELTVYSQEALEKFSELVDIIDDSDTFIENVNNIELYCLVNQNYWLIIFQICLFLYLMIYHFFFIQKISEVEIKIILYYKKYFSHYFMQKAMFIQIKFQFHLNTEINNVLKWFTSDVLFDFDLFQDYKLQTINEQISIGQLQLNKHKMIKNQLITYVRYIEQLNEDYYIVFKSIRLEDQYQSKIVSNIGQQWEGKIMLGGLRISQREGKLIIRGYIDGDFKIKAGYKLTIKTLREKVIGCINKVREQFS